MAIFGRKKQQRPDNTLSAADKPTDQKISHDPVLERDDKQDDLDIRQTEVPQTAEPEYATGLRLVGVGVAICLAIFLIALDMTILGTAIPRITDEFNSIQDIGWYGAAFFLTIGASQAAWGKAYTYFDLKWVFLISMAVFELGSLLCGAAQSSAMLIVGRAIAGLGGGGIGAGCYSIIFYSVPLQKAPALTGLLGGTYVVASVIGPLLGGVFVDHSTWRLCFYFNLPVGAVSIAIIIFFFRTPVQAKPVSASWKEKLIQFDISGSALLLSAFTCLVLALQWGGVTKAWSDSTVIGTFVGFAVILIAFGVNEWYLGQRALFTPDIVKNKTLLIMSSFIALACGSFFVLLYYLPLYFQVAKGVSAQESGIRNLPLIIGTGVMSVASGGFITKTGRYLELMIGGAVLLAVGCGLIYTLDIDSSSGKWIGYQIVAGLGQGALFNIPMIVTQNLMADKVARVTAIILFFQCIAGAIWVASAQSLFTNDLIESAHQKLPNLNSGVVVGTGATDLRGVFHGAQLPLVIEAYMAGIRKAFLLTIPLACLAAMTATFALVVDYRVLNLTAPGAAAGGAAGAAAPVDKDDPEATAVNSRGSGEEKA